MWKLKNNVDMKETQNLLAVSKDLIQTRQSIAIQKVSFRQSQKYESVPPLFSTNFQLGFRQNQRLKRGSI